MILWKSDGLSAPSWLHWNPIFRGEWLLNPQWWGLVSSHGVLLSVVNTVEKNAQICFCLHRHLSYFPSPEKGDGRNWGKKQNPRPYPFLSAYIRMQNSLCKLESATGLLGSWQWHCQSLKVKLWVKLREENLSMLFLNNQYKHTVHSARIA